MRTANIESSCSFVQSDHRLVLCGWTKTSLATTNETEHVLFGLLRPTNEQLNSIFAARMQFCMISLQNLSDQLSAGRIGSRIPAKVATEDN